MSSDEDKAPGDKAVDDLSWSELQRAIEHSPKHQRIVARHRAILIISAISFGVGLIWVFLLCHLGKTIVDANKWLIFHFMIILVMILTNTGLAWLFRRNIEAEIVLHDESLLAEPWILRIDIFRTMLPFFVAICLVFYVFAKLRTVVTPEAFIENWCGPTGAGRARLHIILKSRRLILWLLTQYESTVHENVSLVPSFVFAGKYSFLAVPLLNLRLLTEWTVQFACLLVLAFVAELWICWILYHDPVLNPPPEELKREEEAEEKAQIERQRKKRIRKGKRKQLSSGARGPSGGVVDSESDDLLRLSSSGEEFGLQQGIDRTKSLGQRTQGSGSRRT
ncbi:hypothetical protein OIV83_002038 [Microbotryomycetes sp. JL201]|nr:hypothetical protein OIV83_002038 [Microbotryomycetes sp. JL201]